MSAIRRKGLILLILSLLFILAGCSREEDIYREGSFQGKVDDVIVEITMEDNAIKEVDIVEPTRKEVEAKDYQPALKAYDEIPERIIKEQRAEVEVVSGATSSSNKYIEAAKNAIDNASKKW